MPQVLCDVSEGLSERNVNVAVKDANSVRQFLLVDRDFVVEERGRSYLPVEVVYISKEKQVALIELPQEADSGVNRIWVKLSDLNDKSESLTSEAPA